MDYLQLASDRVKLLDLKYKLITESSRCSGDPAKDLFCKIMAGDQSDCIPSVFPKCGPKTAAKCFHDSEYLEKCLDKHPNEAAQLELNTTLIDMHRIPHDLRGPVDEKVSELLAN